MTYVLLDIGGTNTRVAVSENLKEFSRPAKHKTPKQYNDGIAAIVESIKSVVSKDIRGVAIGIRGVLGSDNEELVRDPGKTLEDWEEKPLVADLQAALKTEVFLENDAALAGVGEAVYGAGDGYDIVVYHTVSTGVGGVKIESGEVDRHSVGFEPGHQILDIDRTILGDDIVPTLENLVSGTALEARMSMKPYEIPQADAIWNQLAEYLAHGLRNSILYWSPDVIVLGGSMIVGNPRILLNDIVHHAATVLGDDFTLPDIVDAKLGDDAGLYGAMAYLDQRM